MSAPSEGDGEGDGEDDDMLISGSVDKSGLDDNNLGGDVDMEDAGDA